MIKLQDESRDRQLAELEFVTAAYNPDTEAWHDVTSTGDPVVYRKLLLEGRKNDNSVMICLSLTMPPTYPVGEEPLQVAVRLCDETSHCDHHLRKIALDAQSHIQALAERAANEGVGLEAVFTVLSLVEEWVFQGGWKDFFDQRFLHDQPPTNQETQKKLQPCIVTFGRRLIYSHHIISKVKRADIKALASDHKLTGYMKIGWPGLLIIEGAEDDCIDFYDKIRRWNWQYLVVRGEQQVSLPVSSDDVKTIQAHRSFQSFEEVEDMSIVAQHCRDVGLESLFRTSMKVYDNTAEGNGEFSAEKDDTTFYYSVLIHVDHMNDPKGYRKWLRKAAKETQCYLITKQCYSQDDYSKRPKIVVAVLAASPKHSSAFLKRWRTSRVDVDSRGKACLERKMTIIAEGDLANKLTIGDDSLDWEKANSEDSITISELLLGQLLLKIGGVSWKEAFENLLRCQQEGS